MYTLFIVINFFLDTRLIF